MFTEVAPGIFSVDHQVVEGKTGLIFGTRAVLAVDTGNYPEEGRAMADFVRARGRPPAHLALTHGHGDHILGSGAFRGGEVFARDLTPGVMRGQVEGAARRTGRPAAEIETELAWPTVTFSDKLSLDLGGRTARLFPTPGHSPDSVCVHLVEDRVLFAGDTVVTGIVPAIGDGSGAALQASLARLAELEVEVLVPGHGPVVTGRTRVREWIAWQARYLAELREWVRKELRRGASPDGIADRAEFERFVGDRLERIAYKMERRHRDTVAKIVAEVAEEGSGE
jgi:glyoxylase-like metal-dependent hydrolase (beta-lactamase superfamily II)